MILASAVDHTTADVLIDIAIIVVVARLVGLLFRKLRQPAVVGEIIAGIALGPSLLGAFPGNLPTHLFPMAARPSLQVLADIGIVLFMFIVGLEADLDLIKGRVRLAVSVSLSSIVVPFGLGLGAAVLLHHTYGTVGNQTVKFWPFALFIGASMSITAFPVLARILSERGMHRTTLGTLALACAAVDDVAAWSLLAVVVAVVEASGLLDLPRILMSGALFVGLMIGVVRPLLVKLAARYSDKPRLPPEVLAFVLAGLLTSAWATDRIGIHAIFGAFVFGAIMPKKTAAALVQEVIERIESITVLLLLPIFFIVTGLNVNVRELGLTGLGDMMVILAAAIVGKFIGATLAARAQGVPSRRAMALGTLMNTRGLTELVILNIGLSLGVLDEQLFTLLVVMAVVTTVMTEPLLRLVYPDDMLKADLDEAQRIARGGPTPGYQVLVLLDGSDAGRPLVDLGADLAGPGGLVHLMHFIPRSISPRLDAGVAAELAQMASTVDWLSGLAEHRPEIHVRPHAQFTSDLVADVLTHAERAEVDVVLVTHLPGTDDPTVAALLAGAPCHVVVVANSEHVDPRRPLQVQTGDGVDPDTAFELAARAALGRVARGTTAPGEPALVLLGDPSDEGRARRLGDRLDKLRVPGVKVVMPGVDTATERAATDSAADVVFVGLATTARDVSVAALDELLVSRSATVLAVHSNDDPRRVGLEERMGRLAHSAPIAPEPTSVDAPTPSAATQFDAPTPVVPTESP